MATCKFWRYPDASKRGFPRNPDLWARAVCPFDFLRSTVDQWNFLLVCVWLVHMIMPNHFGAQVVTRFHAFHSPKWGSFPPVSLKRPCTCTTARVCVAPHTWELGLAFLTTSYAFIRSTHGGYGGMLAPNGRQMDVLFLGRSTGPGSSAPLDILPVGVAQWTFLLVCVWLVHMIIPNHFGAQVVPKWFWGTSCPKMIG